MTKTSLLSSFRNKESPGEEKLPDPNESLTEKPVSLFEAPKPVSA